MTIPEQYSANLLREYNFLIGSLSDQNNANICSLTGSAHLAKRLAGPALEVNGSTDYATHAAVNLTGDFTIICYCRPRSIDSSDNTILTTGAVNPARLEFNNGNQIRMLLQDLSPISVTYSIAANDYINKWSVLAATRSGNTTTIYVNGIEVASDTLTGTLNSDMEYIGSLAGASRFFNGDIAYAAYFNTAITPADMYTYYAELRALNYPSKVVAKFSATDGSGDNDGWKTDWAASVSDAAITAGFVENTPLEVLSGSWQVVSDSINGTNIKALKCTAVGVSSLCTSCMGQTPTEAAYGEWEFWFKKDSGGTSTLNIMLTATVEGAYNAAGQNGYLMNLGDSEQVYLYRVTNGTPTLLGGKIAAYTENTWHKLTVTRSLTGVWTMYLDDVLFTATSGSNPVTDNTYTTSNYITFSGNIAAGDFVSLSDISGGHSFIKKLL